MDRQNPYFSPVNVAAAQNPDGSWVIGLTASGTYSVRLTAPELVSSGTMTFQVRRTRLNQWDVDGGTVTMVNGSVEVSLVGKELVTLVSTSSVANQRPMANAGSDATITLPTSSIGLNGSGSDPDGSIASYAWPCTSKPVGAANPIFSAATNPSSTATGLVAGSYTFCLTVTDNQGATDVDDVVITVTPALVVNTAPTIFTVSNQTITEDAAAAALAVTVGDAETSASALTFTAVATDTTLLPGSGIAVGGTGASRTVTLTPAADR